MSFCTPKSRVSGCILCYSGVKGRASYPGHRGYRKPRTPSRWEGYMALRRMENECRANGATSALLDDAFRKPYPTLVSYLEDLTFDDGTERTRSTLLVFIEDGMVKLCLSDKHYERTTWVAGLGFKTALAALEKGLESGQCEWRKMTPWKGRGKK